MQFCSDFGRAAETQKCWLKYAMIGVCGDLLDEILMLSKWNVEQAHVTLIVNPDLMD